MKSAAICIWGLRRAARRPEAWILLLAGTLVIPLCRALSPFLNLGLDPAWALARQWLVPMEMMGASLAITFLGGQRNFLELLAPRTLWQGELSVLCVGVFLISLPLALGAMAAHGQWILPLEWVQAWGTEGLLVSLAGFWVLRLPAKTSVRVLVLWITLWVLPGLVA